MSAACNLPGKLQVRIQPPNVFSFSVELQNCERPTVAQRTEPCQQATRFLPGSIPENYDRYMVPLIFESYARDMAQKASALSPKAVLETAAGSGVVTRALAPMLSPDASYVVTDLNQPMLDYAATRQKQDNRITWRQADAQALPFEDAAFDLVCCQFGVDVLPRPPVRLPRGPARAQAGRIFPVQRLGPHRGKRVRG